MITKSIFLVGLGGLFIVTGVICNEWVLASYASHHGVLSTFSRIVIWVFDLLCVSVGFLLIKYRSEIRFREFGFSMIVLAILLLLLEGGLRLVESFPRTLELSDSLGWRPIANNDIKSKNRAFGDISYTTTRYGFRRFGDLKTKKLRIFVIGDSFTQAVNVSDGNTYYDYLAKNNDNVEMFVYGAGGYGTLQEHMVLDKFYDTVKPDIILWQYCDNDPIDNVYELEYRDVRNNNRKRRPYFVNGEIEQRWPLPPIIGFTLRYSYLVGKLYQVYAYSVLYRGAAQADLSANKDNMLEKGFTVTSDIMGLVKNRVGETPIVAFTMTDLNRPKWIGNLFEAVAQKNGLHYIEGITQAISDAKSSGIIVDGDPYDSHWNDVGHSITGQMILNYITEHGLLEK